MEPPPAEFTLICIDNSKRMFWLDHIFNDQLDAIELYCAAVFKCNPNSKVCLYTMSSLQYGILVHPTSDLQQILRCLQDLQCEGHTDFSDALARAGAIFSRSAPPNMKRRLLMFVGSRINLGYRQSEWYGRKLKERGVALNVVNFFLLKIDTSLEGVSILSDEYHYGRDELGELVTTVGNNSQIVDVGDESYILDIVSKSILEKNLRYLEKKAAADNEYVEAPGIQAPRIKYGNLLKTTRNEKKGIIASQIYINMFDIPGLTSVFGPGKYNDLSNHTFVRPGLRLRGDHNKSAADDEYGNLSKKTAHISGKENQEKAEENVSVKQESELSCNENYKAAAQGKCIEVFDKPQTFCDPMRSIHKEKSRSAADDECFQAPEVQYLTPHPRRARKKKNQKKKPIFKQESELSCNEKNKSAADDEYGNLSKKTTHISGNENQEKAEENVSVKQEELELSCNEKYEAAAQGIGIKVFDIYAEMRSIEQCHKDKSTSAAYDESVQAPEIPYLSKVTPHPRRARKKKNQKKMQMFKQESELSCNEKNQVAAE